MEKTKQKGKILIYAIIISSIIFLALHNNELYFQEYSNIILLNVFRISLFATLLFFLYKKHNWARYILATISSILVLGGIIGVFLIDMSWMKPSDTLYLGLMILCMLFNVTVLLFSKDLKYYMDLK